MAAGCYIIFSKMLSKYYVGAFQKNIEERIEKHNNQFYGKHRFTAKANDWELFCLIDCESYTQALKIEKHIKKMKSKIFIQNLVKYPEIIEKLKTKYKS